MVFYGLKYDFVNTYSDFIFPRCFQNNSILFFLLAEVVQKPNSSSFGKQSINSLSTNSWKQSFKIPLSSSLTKKERVSLLTENEKLKSHIEIDRELLKRDYISKDKAKSDERSLLFVFGWFFLCLTGSMGSIANWAHASGLIIGLGWGYLSALKWNWGSNK